MTPLVETAMDHSLGEADALWIFYDNGGMIPDEECRSELLLRIEDSQLEYPDIETEYNRLGALWEHVEKAVLGERIDR